MIWRPQSVWYNSKQFVVVIRRLLPSEDLSLSCLSPPYPVKGKGRGSFSLSWNRMFGKQWGREQCHLEQNRKSFPLGMGPQRLTLMTEPFRGQGEQNPGIEGILRFQLWYNYKMQKAIYLHFCNIPELWTSKARLDLTANYHTSR